MRAWSGHKCFARACVALVYTCVCVCPLLTRVLCASSRAGIVERWLLVRAPLGRWTLPPRAPPQGLERPRPSLKDSAGVQSQAIPDFEGPPGAQAHPKESTPAHPHGRLKPSPRTFLRERPRHGHPSDVPGARSAPRPPPTSSLGRRAPQAPQAPSGAQSARNPPPSIPLGRSAPQSPSKGPPWGVVRPRPFPEDAPGSQCARTLGGER
jgi:hypothetical protein